MKGKKFKKNEYFSSSIECRHIGTKKPTGTIEQALIDTATKVYQDGEITRNTNGKADIEYLNVFQELSQMVHADESLVEGIFLPESYSEDLRILFTNLDLNYGHVVESEEETVIILNFSIVPL